MDRYLSINALDDIVGGHLTRSVSNKVDLLRQGKGTSSFHLGACSSLDPPSVEKGNLGLVTRAQDESLASSNSTNEQISFEGNQIIGQSTTGLTEDKFGSFRGFPPHDISEIKRGKSKKCICHRIFIIVIF